MRTPRRIRATVSVLGPLLLLTALSTVANAQPPIAPGQPAPLVTDATAQHLGATRRSAPIALDGRLDEADWARATPTREWRQVMPEQGVLPRARTEARLLLDDDALYVGFMVWRAPNAPATPRGRNLQRDFLYPEHDAVAVLLDPLGDRRTMYMFGIAAGGNIDDRLYTIGVGVDLDWDARWRARTTVSDSGWMAEVRIPWSAIPRGSGTAAWGLNFYRVERSLNEVSLWAPVPRGSIVLRGDYAGRLDSMPTGRSASPWSPATMQWQPYVRSGWSRAEGAVAKDNIEFGADARWRPMRGTSIDLTVNTDFAQADVDRQVVNLSRFSVFLPERRAFFQEGRQLFSSGIDDRIQPFFTRRIGLDEAGQSVPILGAARLLQRGRNGQLGVLAVRQGASATAAQSDIAALRAVRSVSSRLRLGLTMAGRRDTRTDSLAAAGFDQERRHLTSGVDAVVQLGPVTTLDASVSATSTRDRVGEAFGTFAEAGHVRLQHLGSRFGSTSAVEFVERAYDPLVGFVGRRDYVRAFSGGEWDLRPAWRPAGVLRLVPGYEAAVVTSATSRQLEERRIRVQPLVLERRDGSRLQFGMEQDRQRLARAFTVVPGLTVSPGTYDTWRALATVSIDPSRPLAARAELTRGGYFGGDVTTLASTVQYTPTPRVATILRHTVAAFDGVGRDSVGGATSRTTHLIVPELRLAWNPRLQLSVFQQLNSATRMRSTNVRASWELAPLSYLHVVWNQRRAGPGPASIAAPTGNQELIVKLSYILGR